MAWPDRSIPTTTTPRTGTTAPKDPMTVAAPAPYERTQSAGNPSPYYAGGTGTPPPGSYHAGVDKPLEPGQTYGQLILPAGWAGIGGANDSGPLTYIPWQNNPDGSWTAATTAMVNAIKNGTYTGNPADYSDGTDPNGGGTTGGGGGGTGTGGAGGAGGTGGTGGASAGGFNAEQNSLLAYVKGILTQYGLEDPELLGFAKQAIASGWDANRIMNELRAHPAYLKNPLFAANMERSRNGGGFMAEGQIIAYKNEVKRLSKQFGFKEPSDNYIAEGLKNGKSLAEFEHILGIQRRIQEYGEPVRRYAEEWLGVQLGDQDLFEVFSDEHDTADFDRAFKLAQYQGRPIMLGFAGRSAEEARAYEMLGLNPDEVFSRFESAKGVKFRTDRLALIEGDVIGSMDRDALQTVLKGNEDLVVRASVLQDSRAQQELQGLLMRESARWRTGGGTTTSQGGQAVGLLSGADRQTFG